MATKVWTGASDASWNTSGNWSPTGVPAADDIVQFGNGVGATNNPCNLGVAATNAVRSVDFTGYTGTFTFTSGGTLNISGNASGGTAGILTLASGATYTLSGGTIAFGAGSSGTYGITTNGKTLPNISFSAGNTITFQFLDNNTAGAVSVVGNSSFTLATNGNTCNWTSFTVNTNQSAFTMNLSTSTINLSSISGTPWSFSTAGRGHDMTSSTIVINSASSSSRTFAGGGTGASPMTYGALTYTVAGSTGGLTITGTNKFTTLSFSDASNARTLTLPVSPNYTQINTAFNVNGTSGKLMTIAPSTASQFATIYFNGNGTVNCNYLSLSFSVGAQSKNWNTTTDTPNAFNDFGHEGAVSSDGYVFICGGATSGGTIQTTVSSCKINSDGSFGTWHNTNALGTAVALHSVAVYNGYMYATGGTTTGGVDQTLVQYAQINSGGTTGAWSTTTAFTQKRRGHATFAKDGYLYILGGDLAGDSTVFSDVQYSAISAVNGTVGAWSSTTSLPENRAYFGCCQYNGKVYIAGGYSGAAFYNTVKYNTINANGTFGASWTTTSNLPQTLFNCVLVVDRGYMFAIGMQPAGGQETGLIFRAVINSDGSLGTWSYVNSYPPPVARRGILLYNNYLYTYSGGVISPLNQRVDYGRTYDDASAIFYANSTSTNGGNNYGWNFTAPVNTAGQLPMMGTG